ncbi:cell division protein FtsZ [Parabacteroides sp. OttesenSCG-928-N08]|nr:cell division protein FtsZ [Parabacteroides sp. OttesenSCG-928-N08]
METKILEFDYPKDSPRIIKVIGVGGGGGNAVTHMYKAGIHDVSFVLCNTDNQALDRSDVPQRITLGPGVTQGLGAGNKPEKAKMAAEESVDEIKNLLSDGTKMVFITAGMGGGTGTGAAPVIARIAKEMGILTVGIVTIPFLFEGERKIIQALTGVEEIAQNVDALLVINNERLREIYADLTLINAFGKADDTLTIAAKSIAEIITLPGIINLDFADVNTTMKDGGVALMSNGYGEGEGRVRQAITDALNSPLLSNNDVKHAKKILFNIYFSKEAEMQMEEMNEVDIFMKEFNRDIDVIWGTAIDETLGNQIKITVLATGFTVDNIPQIVDKHRRDAAALTEEELRQQEESLQREQRNKALIDTYYGTLAGNIGQFSYRPVPFIFTLNELDEDTIIAKLEEQPAYQRDAKAIRKRKKTADVSVEVNAPTEQTPTTHTPQPPKKSTNIKF